MEIVYIFLLMAYLLNQYLVYCFEKMIYFAFFTFSNNWLLQLFSNGWLNIISLLIADVFCIGKTQNYARLTVKHEDYSTRKPLLKHL